MEKYTTARAETDSKLQQLIESCNKVSKILEEEWKKIQKGHDDLQAKKDDLAKQNGGSADVSDDDVLDINAGGEIIRVTRGTLTQIKGSRLEALFSGRWEKQLQRDLKGHIFLDVNPTCFRCIVDYLNVCVIAPLDTPPDLSQTDSENQVYLDALLIAFGLYDDCCPVDSTILTDPKHISALTGFLEEDNIDSGLTLLYRGSQDGMDTASFHRKCDNQGPTITVVKSSGDYIFGGFSDKHWGGDGCWTRSDKAFLFGLFCHGGQEPVKMRLNGGTNKRHALYCNSSYGPTFGLGHDLETLRVTYSCLGNTYAIPPRGNTCYFTGAKNYNISEIEVFKVENCRSQPPPASSVQNQPRHQLSLDNFPADIQKSFQAQKEALQDASNELQLLQDNFEKEQAVVQAFCCPKGGDDVVTMNVSGRSMAVKQSTLANYPDSVLYKQFVDVNWNGRENRKRKASPREWSKEEVITWSKNINGLSEDVSTKFNDVTGAELLVMGREDIKDLGIKRPGSVALVVDAVQELRDDDEAKSAAFIQHSDYCFGKILDHMRLKAMHKHLGLSDPEPPRIRESDKKKYELIVGYFFPNQETASQFLT